MIQKKNTTVKKLIIAIVLILFLLLLVCAGLLLMRSMIRAAEQDYRSRYISFALSTGDCDYTESTDILSNPGGYYDLRGYTLSQLDTDALSQKLAQDISYSSDEQLVLLEINLCRYRTGELDDAALAQTDAILSAWEQAGFRIILRFLYDWDGNAAASEPEDIELVKSHMSGIAPVVNAHAAAIYCMQGIFVGNFAEMNGGNFMDPDSMCELMAHLADVIDPDIFLSVRTPAQRRLILDSAECFPAGDSLAARLGLYNDGMLGSETDYGTYGVTDQSEAAPGTGWLRAQELDYQDTLCRQVPNGGEAVVDNPYNDADAAITDLAKMHVSYLSRMHHAEVLEKWKNSTVQTDDVWAGTDAYTYIGAHMGIRYRCAAVTASEYDCWTDAAASLTLTWCNTGFAPSYEPLALTLRVLDEQGQLVEQTTYEDQSLTDLCNGECEDITLPLKLSSYAAGSYRVYLSCTYAQTGKALELAGRLPRSGESYEVASFTVDRTPSSMPSEKELLRSYISHLRESSAD